MVTWLKLASNYLLERKTNVQFQIFCMNDKNYSGRLNAKKYTILNETTLYINTSFDSSRIWLLKAVVKINYICIYTVSQNWQQFGQKCKCNLQFQVSQLFKFGFDRCHLASTVLPAFEFNSLVTDMYFTILAFNTV